MFEKIRSGVLVAAIAVLAVLTVSGCSVTGMAIGKLSEGHAEKKHTVVKSDHRLISPGSYVALQTTSGVTIRGRFQGSAKFSESEYRDRYFVPDSLSGRVPSLGQPLTLNLRNGQALLGRLVGFDFAAGTSSLPECIVLQTNEEDSAHVLLSGLLQISTAAGDSIDPKELAALMNRGILPSLHYMVLDLAPTASDTVSASELDARADEIARARVLSLRRQDGTMLTFDDDGGRYYRESQKIVGRDPLGTRSVIQASDLSQLEFSSPLGTPYHHRIAVSDVTNVVAWKSSNAGMTGLAIGAVIDAALIVGLIALAGSLGSI